MLRSRVLVSLSVVLTTLLPTVARAQFAGVGGTGQETASIKANGDMSVRCEIHVSDAPGKRTPPAEPIAIFESAKLTYIEPGKGGPSDEFVLSAPYEAFHLRLTAQEVPGKITTYMYSITLWDEVNYRGDDSQYILFDAQKLAPGGRVFFQASFKVADSPTSDRLVANCILKKL